MGAIEFASRVPRHKRHALERLLFFNGCQERVARDIVDVIDRYGPPEIYDDGEGLRVRVATLPDVQCLFAFERATQNPPAAKKRCTRSGGKNGVSVATVAAWRRPG